MCGIVGYIQKQTKSYTNQIHNAIKVLSSRGPNHQEIKKYGYVILGHTRLSILDLSHDSDQPLEYKKYSLVYNGELYNYKELREELKGYGYTFDTSGDTEVVLKAYDYWGQDCVDHFNGMWAFALYNQEEKVLFCSRDNFGIKPFFYYEDDDVFVFSSEIKAILEFVHNRQINYDVIVPYIARGIVDFSEMTFFKDIYRLLPSHNLAFDIQTSQFKIIKYYDIKKQNSDNLSHEDIYNLLEDSIALRLRSDVKVGTCLSGGLDSSSIAAIAHKFYGKNLEAIHAKSSLQSNDESMYAQKVAEHLGIKLHIIEPTHQQFWENVDTLVYTQDEPFSSTSIFMQYFLMQKAKEIGCAVMLDGQGADEVFLGYEHYFPIIYDETIQKDSKSASSFLDNLKLFKITKENILFEYNRLNDFEQTWNLIVEKGNFNPQVLNKKICKDLLNYENILEFQKKEIFTKNMQALLRYEDRDSMQFSIEARLPYLDYRLVEAVVNSNITKKFDNGYLKYLLRKSIETQDLLPKDILWRYNKMGFESPQEKWIEVYKDQMLKEIEKSDILKKIFTKIDIRRNDFLWRVFCIARWENVFEVVS